MGYTWLEAHGLIAGAPEWEETERQGRKEAAGE